LNSNITAVSVGCLSVSRISYHTDLQQVTSLVIPLGVIAELVIGHWRALGLIARSTLSADELNQVAPRLRPSIKYPMEFLRSDFEWAFTKTDSGQALTGLSHRLTASLFCAPPADRLIRKPLPLGVSAAEPISFELRKARDDEFYLMIAECIDAHALVASEDRTKLKLQHAA
jgi:hypothetical protein